MTTQKEKPKPGPEAESLKLDGNWKDRLAQALKKARPEGGWPKPKAARKREKKK